MSPFRGRFFCLGVIVALNSVASAVEAQGTKFVAVTGVLLDGTSQRPISDVRVLVDGDHLGFVTDSLGNFRITPLLEGLHEIEFRRPGFEIRAFRLSVDADSPSVLDAGAIVLLPTENRTAFLDGVVTDVETDRPLFGTFVYLNGELAGMTGGDGRFLLPGILLARGYNEVNFRRMGYRPISRELWIDQEEPVLTMDVKVEKLPVRLEEINITADRAVWARGRLVEFYRRMRFGGGEFLSPDEIEEIPATHTTDLLRRMNGVRVVQTSGSSQVRFWASTVSCRNPLAKNHDREQLMGEGVPSFSGGSDRTEGPDVYIDGLLVRDAGSSIDQLVPVSHIAAIEVYDSPAAIPPQFNRINNCGVILIWTKES